MNKSQKFKEKYKVKILIAIIGGIFSISAVIISAVANKANNSMASVVPDDLKSQPYSASNKNVSLFQLQPSEPGDSAVLLKKDESFGQYVQCIKLNAHGYIEMPDLLNRAKIFNTALIYNLNSQYNTFRFFLNSKITSEDNCYLVIYLDGEMYNTYLLNESDIESIYYEVNIKNVDDIIFVVAMESENEGLNAENYALIIEPSLY